MSRLSHTILSPEQIAAVEAGQGFAHAEDPQSRRKFLVIEHGIIPSLDEEYFREKLVEGMQAIHTGEVSDWNLDQFKATLLQRHAEQSPKS